MMRIVTVNVVVPPMPVYHAQYMVLLNRSCRYVLMKARDNPDAIIMPFITLLAVHCPDYNGLKRSRVRELAMRIMQPLYVGNLKPVESAIQQVVEKLLGAQYVEAIKLKGDF